MHLWTLLSSDRGVYAFVPLRVAVWWWRRCGLQVPESLRASIYGTFRVPMNLLVVIIELASPSSMWSFLTCTVLLLVAVGCFHAAHKGISAQEASKGAGADGAPAVSKTEASPLMSKSSPLLAP